MHWTHAAGRAKGSPWYGRDICWFSNVGWQPQYCTTRLVIPVFRNLFFGPKKPFLTGFLRISFFSCVFWRNFSQERGFGGGRRNSCFFSFLQVFFAGIPVGQEFLYLPRNPPYSGGFRRIPVPAKSCWLWPATEEGTLLSKIWTKIDLLTSLQNRTWPWCPLPPSSADASWPEGEGCRRGRDGTGRGGCVDGWSAGGCRVGDDNCNGGCRQQQTTNNNQQQARGKAVSGGDNDRPLKTPKRISFQFIYSTDKI